MMRRRGLQIRYSMRQDEIIFRTIVIAKSAQYEILTDNCQIYAKGISHMRKR